MQDKFSFRNTYVGDILFRIINLPEKYVVVDCDETHVRLIKLTSGNKLFRKIKRYTYAELETMNLNK